MKFPCRKLQLAPGDALSLYTDGVTETLNPKEELFGEDRLKATLNAPETQGKKPADLLPHIRAVLSDFACGAEQADDITMLSIIYLGPESKKEASHPMRTLTVPADTKRPEAVQTFTDADLDAAECPMETRIQIQIAVEELFVNIAHYVKTTMDEVSYAWEDGCSILTIQKPGIEMNLKNREAFFPGPPGFALFCVFNHLGFPQDVDLNLTGVFHFLLDLLG